MKIILAKICKTILKPLMVLIIFTIFVYFSVMFKDSLNLSEASLMVLVTISTLFSILLPNINRLKSVSITKGELILQEVKESEAAVKELAIATAELVEASTENMVTYGFDEEKYRETLEKVKRLAK